VKKEEIKKLVVFGTFFKSKMGGIKDILVLLGEGKRVKEIDNKYQREKFFGPYGLKELARLYRGFSLNQLKVLFLDYCRKNLLKGMVEAVTEFKKRGFLVGALSSNPQFMMDVLKEILALDFAKGTQLEFRKGMATGKILEGFDRYKKAKTLQEIRKKYALNKKDVIFIGRPTVSHLPMMKEAGCFIGFNPLKESIEEISRIIVTNRALRKSFSPEGFRGKV